jgi:soluble lytic murein transglycosylase-like protein
MTKYWSKAGRFFTGSRRLRTGLESSGLKRDLQLIRRSIHYKLKNRVRLSPAEVHLLKNYASLEHKFFAPSLAACSLQVSGALLRPCAKFGALAGLAVVLSGNSTALISMADESPEEGIEIESVEAAALSEAELNIPELALALARDTSSENDGDIPEQPAAAGSDVALPILRTLNPKTSNKNETAALVPAVFTAPEPLKTVPGNRPSDEEQLRQQRSLIKFLSGLIAAYRPSITDCGSIARYIVELSASEDIDPFYVAAVISIESRFHSGAQSDAGALGLMQLLPTTARAVSHKQTGSKRSPALVDPRTNIRLGIGYLKQLEEKYRGNRFLALSAYNWGPANVDKTGLRKYRIPTSVRKYSDTVLARTQSWQRHYAKANESANSLGHVVVAAK